MVLNGPKWFKMVQNGEKWSKSPKMVRGAPKLLVDNIAFVVYLDLPPLVFAATFPLPKYPQLFSKVQFTAIWSDSV